MRVSGCHDQEVWVQKRNGNTRSSVKIVVNMGVGEAKENPKVLEACSQLIWKQLQDRSPLYDKSQEINSKLQDKRRTGYRMQGYTPR
jgi:ribosomal protein L5